MKNSEKKALLIIAVLFLAALFNNYIYLLIKSSNFRSIITWSILDILAISLLGYQKDKSLNKTDTTQIVIIYSLTFLILKYIGALAFSYYRSPYILTFFKILSNITPVVIIIILSEIFRYIIISKTNHKYLIILLIVGLSTYNIIINLPSYSFNSALDIFKLIGYLIIPTILNNLLLTYITKKYGYLPSIIYRLIFELYLFIIPIFPDYGLYFESLFNIIIPTLIFLRLNNAKEKPNYRSNKKFINILITIPLTAFLIIVVGLVSGLFTYYAMAIGSNSMVPTFARGSTIILKKVNDNILNNLTVGDIIAYQHDNKIVVHRITKIKQLNNNLIINTKGDNNESADDWDILPNDIRGQVIYTIPYLGLPSVWLEESFNK